MAQLARFLKQESISLDVAPDLELPEEMTARDLSRIKEEILGRLADLLCGTGKVANRSKLFQDLVNRERKATTAVGKGIAVPHVRTMQAREFTMAVGIAPRGFPFGAPDGEPVRIFVAMVAPPYDDKLYLQVYQQLAQVFLEEGALERILEAREAGEIIRILSE
ncbi:MAG: PTS sugar transporter subunit IIA [Planctomycetes bacterium]|nr:PTS sugar transporter subunit IIA [Planctomycetota bacterium]